MSGVWTLDVIMTLVFGVFGVMVAILGFRFRGSICHGVSRVLQFTRKEPGNAKPTFPLKSLEFAL
jgi:hypothetical protein